MTECGVPSRQVLNQFYFYQKWIRIVGLSFSEVDNKDNLQPDCFDRISLVIISDVTQIFRFDNLYGFSPWFFKTDYSIRSYFYEIKVLAIYEICFHLN